MKWYSKYLQVYEQPFASAPPEVVGFVKKKLRKLSENKQLNPEKPDVPLNKNDAFQKVQKRHVQEKR